MKVFDANISDMVVLFMKNRISSAREIGHINSLLHDICGIRNFFANSTEVEHIADQFNEYSTPNVCETEMEYGDFQTNRQLAGQIVRKLKAIGARPKILVEPTCGKGNFILAALQAFDNLERIYGIEIQEKYVWQLKFNVLDFFLRNPDKKRPDIRIAHASIFGYDYSDIKKQLGNDELLIIGNPPWVTNSALGAINSANLPQKSNFKQMRGLDAVTGKGNFDIAEYITFDLLKHFGRCNGNMAFLIKNAVVRNILQELPKSKLPIANLRQQNIDSKKEFNVSVDASLFICRLNQQTELVCKESDFYTDKPGKEFGWKNNKFMSDLSLANCDIDGRSPFEWRQGVKHDCSKVMEITQDGSLFRNKLGEQFALENDLVYPLMKSSDLQNANARPSKKRVIITQKHVGQNTAYIQQYPQTFEYLRRHIDYFKNRKSIIYKNKCDYSIFGIGDYSFKPYKIAISGLYKICRFVLVQPQDGKPVMLDDTCYFIGFDTLEHAKHICQLLNSEIVGNFLKSISFADAKRVITKELLMRIDLNKAAMLNGDAMALDIIAKSSCKQPELFNNIGFNTSKSASTANIAAAT